MSHEAQQEKTPHHNAETTNTAQLGLTISLHTLDCLQIRGEIGAEAESESKPFNFLLRGVRIVFSMHNPRGLEALPGDLGEGHRTAASPSQTGAVASGINR